MAKTNKSSMGIFETRVTKLIPLVSFMTRRQIIGYVRKKTDWDVSIKQIDNYRYKAQEYIQKGLEEKRKTAIQDIVNNYSNLYMKALQVDDFRSAITIQEKMTRILGVDKILDEDTNDNSQTVELKFEVIGDD